MYYSIGEVANKLNIPTSTLRYYDREGLLSNVKRTSGGIRIFSDMEISALSMVECLKATGMQLKDIKRFLDWCMEGDKTLEKRRDMYFERKEAVKKQMEELQNTMDVIEYKCWYYETACAAGTEAAPRNIPTEQIPDFARKGKAALESVFSK
jgi:DNA-binding transcriptional MerR regulator